MSEHEPVIFERNEHNISRRDIDPDALKVLYRLARHDYIAYLVGGGVRDLLLGRNPKDFDVSTDASPNQIRKIFRNCFLIGRRFRLAHIKYGTKIIETSTFRRQPQPENGELLQMNDNEFGTPEEDARRRDFTINGLFYNVEDFCIIDYVGGMKDLEKRIIRSIGDPAIRFQEDPVRMIRAIRFASRLDFSIEEETYQAIQRYSKELSKASAPRMLEEIYRLFAFSSGYKAIRLMYESSLLKIVSPEVSKYIRNAEYNGEEPLIWKYLTALDNGDVITSKIDNALLLAGLFFPAMLSLIDKPDSSITQKSLLKSFLTIVEPFIQRYRVPRKTKDRLVKILTMQHRFMTRSRRGFNKKRFVSLSWFLDALSLHELYLTATGKDFSRADEWRKLWEEHQEELETQSQESQDNSKRTARKKRRNRRRSKRAKKAAAQSKQQTTDSSAAQTKEPSATTDRPARRDSRADTTQHTQKPRKTEPITPMSIIKKTAEERNNL